MGVKSVVRVTTLPLYVYLIKHAALSRGAARILVRTVRGGYVARRTEDFERTRS